VDITAGQQADTVPVTVRNPNTRPLRITGAQTNSPYTITADTCLAHPVPPSGSCTITVQFAPTVFGTDKQILAVNSAAGTSITQLTSAGDAKLTVTITGSGSGSVSDGNAFNCASGSCSEVVTKQLTITLTASVYGFNGWGGNCQASGTNTTCQVTITSDANVSADFEPELG